MTTETLKLVFMSQLIEESIKWWHFEHVFVKMGCYWTYWCRHMAEGLGCVESLAGDSSFYTDTKIGADIL